LTRVAQDTQTLVPAQQPDTAKL